MMKYRLILRGFNRYNGLTETHNKNINISIFLLSCGYYLVGFYNVEKHVWTKLIKQLYRYEFNLINK